MKEYIKLSNYISWANKECVQDVLSKNKSLDLLYRDGSFFTMAIESNYIDIVDSLINYFNKYQLAKYTPYTIEYQLLKNKLRSALEYAIEEVELSREMKNILSPYIDFDVSEHNDSFTDNEQMHGDFLLKFK